MTKPRPDDLFRHIGQLQENHPDLNIQMVAATDSTQKQVEPNSVLIADSQEAGVGRRGNQWLSPPGQAISLSFRFQLPLKVAEFSGFQLTVALAATACLRYFGCQHQRLVKWPNDLYFEGRKFGGILINLSPGKNNQTTDVIIGIGLNWRLNDETEKQVDQAICNIPLKNKPDRGLFIDCLLDQIKHNNQRFCDQGLSPFLLEWSEQDSLHSCRIELQQDQQCIRGDYTGLSSQGELQISIKGQIRRFGSGEVRVRPL
jgi:BirA family biotin operon repressor/biotin-[acetyl-CoA-carboxylase] ligase